VKLDSFEISIYSCTVEAYLTSKFFVIEDISFILHGSYRVGELQRRHPILRESRSRAVGACESARVWVYRREEQGKARCSLLLRFLCPGNVKKQCNWTQEMKQGRRAELRQSRGDNEEERSE